MVDKRRSTNRGPKRPFRVIGIVKRHNSVASVLLNGGSMKMSM
jgi:hypothetical protein